MDKAILLGALVFYLLLAGALVTMIGDSYPDEKIGASYGNYWLVSDLLVGLSILPPIAIIGLIVIPFAIIGILIYDIAIPI
jgi:hypothetical protein